MVNNSDGAASSRCDTLVVSEHRDALVQRVQTAAAEGGAGAECVTDVYAAMARLAVQGAGRITRVIVDTRGLDAVEDRFIPVATQLFREVEVIDLRIALDALRETPRASAAETVEHVDAPSQWRWSAPADRDAHAAESATRSADDPAADVPLPEASSSGDPPRIVARIGPAGIDSPAAEADAATAPPNPDGDELTMHDAVRRRMRTAAAESGSTLAAVHRVGPEKPAESHSDGQDDEMAVGESLLSREELDALLGRLEADLREMDR